MEMTFEAERRETPLTFGSEPASFETASLPSGSRTLAAVRR